MAGTLALSLPGMPPTLVLLLPAQKWGLWLGCFLRPLPLEF